MESCALLGGIWKTKRGGCHCDIKKRGTEGGHAKRALNGSKSGGGLGKLYQFTLHDVEG